MSNYEYKFKNINYQEIDKVEKIPYHLGHLMKHGSGDSKGFETFEHLGKCDSLNFFPFGVFESIQSLKKSRVEMTIFLMRSYDETKKNSGREF